MKKKRRSSQYKDNSKVIDMDEARRKRREKHNKERSKAKAKSRSKVKKTSPVIDESTPAGKRKLSLRKKVLKRRAVVFIIAIIIAVLVGASVFHIVKLKAEQHELLKKQEQLKEEKKQLEDEIKSLDNNERVEEQARGKLKLSKPGETVYVPKDGVAPPSATDADTDTEESQDD